MITVNQTVLDADAADADDFELDDRFMFKLMSHMQKA